MRKGDRMISLRSNNKRAKLIASATAVLLSMSLLASTGATASVATSGKWANRTQTMYVITSSSYTPWSNGAAKWRNSSNFKVSTALGTGAGSYSYYAVDVNNSNVDWDGLCTRTYTNGFIVKAILNLNTYYTSQAKYTGIVLAGLTGHEVGHSLGLEHASTAETSSIMFPYTFTSSGAQARALSPSSSDISVVNNLYPLTKFAKTTISAHSEQSSKVVHLEPSWAVHYEDEQALMEAADLVVRGKIVKESVGTFARGNYVDYNTAASLHIDHVLKGETVASDEHVVISQMGGFDGTVLVTAEHTTLLQQEQEVIVFLRKSDDGTYRPINENDGIYVLDNKEFKNIGSSELLNEKLIDVAR